MVNQPTVRHDAATRRFVAETPDGPAELAYEPAGEGVLDLQHTLVPEAERGRGVGESLVRAAVEHARAEGVRLMPTCPFVDAWRRRHPDDAAVFVGR